MINENGEIGPNPAHALTAELVQTRCWALARMARFN